MDEPIPSPALFTGTVPDPERAFPTLSPEQASRIEAHGRRRRTTRGEMLFDAGDKGVPVFVVISGELQVIRPTEHGEILITTYTVPSRNQPARHLRSGRRAWRQRQACRVGGR